jgi:tetratricopeptide (TPR) repeat protein
MMYAGPGRFWREFHVLSRIIDSPGRFEFILASMDLKSAVAFLAFMNALGFVRGGPVENGKREPTDAEWTALDQRYRQAESLRQQNKFAEAEAGYRAVLDEARKMLGETNRVTLLYWTSLAASLGSQGKFAEAVKEYRALVSVSQRSLGSEHPDTLRAQNGLIAALQGDGKMMEAERESRALLPVLERVLGNEHPGAIIGRLNLANQLDAMDNHADAEQQYRVTLARVEKVMGIKSEEWLNCCFGLAFCLYSQEKWDEALKYARRAEEGRTNMLGVRNPFTVDARKLRELIEKQLEKPRSN